LPDDQDENTLEDDEEQPAHQHKRKHQDLRSSNSSDSDTEDTPIKANKINRNAGRPRASDYDDLAKELILLAATVYRCILSTTDAFPDLATEANMVREAWTSVINEMTGAPLALTPDIAKIVSDTLLLGAILIAFQIKARGSQARGEIKDKTKPLVEGLYGFNSGHGRKAIAANRKLAEELKRERGFIYKVYVSFLLRMCFNCLIIKTISINSETDEPERKGMYLHPIIQKAVNVMWFQNKRDEGVQFTEMFKPFPIPAIAFVLTAVRIIYIH
jgi:hypothetical protein